MISFRRINYVKFVTSVFLIIFFIFVIVYADKFTKWEEKLSISTNFIEGDGGISHEISVDAITINIDNQDNGTIQYITQPWDTLFKIASTFGTTIHAIQIANNLKGEPDSGQTITISMDDDGIVYTVQEKTNILVFANKYNLNVQDLMTINYISDETELLHPWQEITINISKEKAYEVALLIKPKPEIIPRTTIAYKPTINKVWGTTPIQKPRTTSTPTTTTETEPTNNSQWKIISKRTYTKDISNSFARWQCTRYVAIISPNIFPYIDEKSQSRPFGWNANQRCDNAKTAGFKIGSKPAAGAVIVYSRLRSSAGHVGKVISYSAAESTMVVRDMNYAGKFIVTERYEDPENSAIKCYIYGK